MALLFFNDKQPMIEEMALKAAHSTSESSVKHKKKKKKKDIIR